MFSLLASSRRGRSTEPAFHVRPRPYKEEESRSKGYRQAALAKYTSTNLTIMLTPPILNTMPLAAFVAFFVGLCGAAATFRFLQRCNKLPLPPQPPGWPLIGNTIEFIRAANRGEMHLLLQRWAEEYGEVMRVQVGPMTNYYLNSPEAVKVSGSTQAYISNVVYIPRGCYPRLTI